MTRRRLSFAILTAWVIAFCTGISLSIFDQTYNRDFGVLKNILLALDSTFIILCMITYCLIFIKILERRKLVNNPQNINAENRQQFVAGNSRFFKITALIILSFFVFILIPDILFHYYSTKDRTVIESLNISLSLGFVADPIVYIFFQDNLRLLLKTKLCTCKKEVTPESDNNQQDTAL